MKVRYVGNFTNDNIAKFRELQTDLQKMKDSGIFYEFSNENPLLPSGIKIILDDSNTEFINKLISWNFLKDDTYTPIDQEAREAERKAEQEKREAERKANQDEINERINKPNLLKSLKEIPYGEKTQQEIATMSYEELTEYHSNMVRKQNCIYEYIRKKNLKDTKENWDKVGSQTLSKIENDLKSLNKKEVNI